MMRDVKLYLLVVLVSALLLISVVQLRVLSERLTEIRKAVNIASLRNRITLHSIAAKYLEDAEIILTDDFEGSLNWSSYGNGTIMLDNVAVNGKYSLKVETPKGKWKFMEALRMIAPPDKKRIGFGFWWLAYSQNFGYIDFGIEFRNANRNYRKAGEIYIYPYSRPYYRIENGSTIQFDPSSGFPSKYDLSTIGGDLCWHYALIIVDFEKDEYVKLIIDDVEYDMSGIKLYDRVPKEGVSEYNMLEVFIIPSSAGNPDESAVALIDDVVVFAIP